MVEGYMKGKKKYEVDDGVLILNNVKYKGYNMYPNHKGSTNKAEAKHNQKVVTTSIIGRELRTVRSSLDAFHIIMAEVEKLTGLSVAKMDILRQSETGKEGEKEALFSYHIDTIEVKSAIATATILLTDTESSMQILGY